MSAQSNSNNHATNLQKKQLLELLTIAIPSTSANNHNDPNNANNPSGLQQQQSAMLSARTFSSYGTLGIAPAASVTVTPRGGITHSSSSSFANLASSSSSSINTRYGASGASVGAGAAAGNLQGAAAAQMRRKKNAKRVKLRTYVSDETSGRYNFVKVHALDIPVDRRWIFRAREQLTSPTSASSSSDVEEPSYHADELDDELDVELLVENGKTMDATGAANKKTERNEKNKHGIDKGEATAGKRQHQEFQPPRVHKQHPPTSIGEQEKKKEDNFDQVKQQQPRKPKRITIVQERKTTKEDGETIKKSVAPKRSKDTKQKKESKRTTKSETVSDKKKKKKESKNENQDSVRNKKMAMLQVANNSADNSSSQSDVSLLSSPSAIEQRKRKLLAEYEEANEVPLSPSNARRQVHDEEELIDSVVDMRSSIEHYAPDTSYDVTNLEKDAVMLNAPEDEEEPVIPLIEGEMFDIAYRNTITQFHKDDIDVLRLKKRKRRRKKKILISKIRRCKSETDLKNLTHDPTVVHFSIELKHQSPDQESEQPPTTLIEQTTEPTIASPREEEIAVTDNTSSDGGNSSIKTESNNDVVTMPKQETDKYRAKDISTTTAKHTVKAVAPKPTTNFVKLNIQKIASINVRRKMRDSMMDNSYHLSNNRSLIFDSSSILHPTSIPATEYDALTPRILMLESARRSISPIKPFVIQDANDIGHIQGSGAGHFLFNNRTSPKREVSHHLRRKLLKSPLRQSTDDPSEHNLEITSVPVRGSPELPNSLNTMTTVARRRSRQETEKPRYKGYVGVFQLDTSPTESSHVIEPLRTAAVYEDKSIPMPVANHRNNSLDRFAYTPNNTNNIATNTMGNNAVQTEPTQQEQQGSPVQEGEAYMKEHNPVGIRTLQQMRKSKESILSSPRFRAKEQAAQAKRNGTNKRAIIDIKLPK